MLTIQKKDRAFECPTRDPSNPAFMVFVRGWSCGHAVFEAQVGISRQSRGPTNVGLLDDDGKYVSRENYTVTKYAAGIALQCNVLGFHKGIFVRDSKDGNVSLEVAARNPETPGSIVRIDSGLFSSQILFDGFVLLLAVLAGVISSRPTAKNSYAGVGRYRSYLLNSIEQIQLLVCNFVGQGRVPQR
jgi:hypothetical protein